VKCKECGNEFRGHKCACGWSRQKQVENSSHPPLLCATAGCPYEARVRVGKLVQVKGLNGPLHGVYTGPWLNLCHSCRDEHVRRENLEWCKAHGLDTPEKQREFRLTILKKGIVKRAVRDRRPGDDDEVIAA